LLPAFTPMLPSAWQVPWLIASATLPAIGQGMASVLFVASIQESVSQPRMAALFSRRSLYFNLTLAASAVAFGLWLEHIPFPLNYQLMYVAAFGFALLSMWHCMQLKPIQVPPLDSAHKATLLPLEPWRSRDFRSMTLIMIVTFVAFYAVFALVNARLIKEMGADEGYMAIFGLVELAAGALISHYAPGLIGRFTYRGSIAIMMMLTALPPLLLAITDHLGIGLLAAVISGASWTFVAMVGISGLYTESTPVHEATYYGIAYHQAYGLAMFAAPFIGTFLVTGGMSLTDALLIGTGLRLVAGAAVGLSWWRHAHAR
jgi:predicted MFS family arabinose efflux permease